MHVKTRKGKKREGNLGTWGGKHSCSSWSLLLYEKRDYSIISNIAVKMTTIALIHRYSKFGKFFSFMCLQRIFGTHGDHERVFYILELELQTVLTHHVGFRNGTQISWKKQVFLTIETIFQLHRYSK